MTDISANNIVEEDSMVELLPDNIRVCFSMSHTMQNLILFNFILLLAYLIYWIYYIPLLLFEGIGYLGVKEFNRAYILTYLIYAILFNITRIVAFSTIYNVFEPLTPTEKDEEKINGLLLICCTLFSIWVIKRGTRFFYKLNQLSSDELQILQQI